MNKEIMYHIREELDLTEQEIVKYQKKKDILITFLTEYAADQITDIKEPVQADTDEKKTIKTISKTGKKMSSDKPGKNGTMKFATYLHNIFKSNPDKTYSSQTLVGTVEKAIASNKINKPDIKGGIKESIGKYLYNFKTRGIIRNTEETGYYIYAGLSEPKTDTKDNHSNTPGYYPGTQLDRLDETIIELLKRKPEVFYPIPTLSNNIRLCKDFGEISKELSGTLYNSIEDSCKKMAKAGIIISNGNQEYKINKAEL